MDILDKAKDLGSTIRESKEMTELKKAEAAFLSDEKSKRLMEEYRTLQMTMARAQRENLSDEEMEVLENNLIKKEDEIGEYEVTSTFFQAKNDFDNMMRQINDVIKYAITGEEPCSKDDCSSCGCGGSCN